MTISFTLCLAANGLLAGFMLYQYSVLNRVVADWAHAFEAAESELEEPEQPHTGWQRALQQLKVVWARSDKLQIKLYAVSFGLALFAFWQNEPISFGLTLSMFAQASLWGLKVAALAPVQSELSDEALLRPRPTQHSRTARSRKPAATTSSAEDSDAAAAERDSDIRRLVNRYARYYTVSTVCAVGSFVCMCLADTDFRSGAAH
jgi:hypothetical protein